MREFDLLRKGRAIVVELYRVQAESLEEAKKKLAENKDRYYVSTDHGDGDWDIYSYEDEWEENETVTDEHIEKAKKWWAKWDEPHGMALVAWIAGTATLYGVLLLLWWIAKALHLVTLD